MWQGAQRGSNIGLPQPLAHFFSFQSETFPDTLDKLYVLKLSHFTFSFPSPPFLCCHNLRFLWLDHCQIVTLDGTWKDDDDIVSRCFQRLWVLDVRFTKGCEQIFSAQMISVMIQLRELNVVGAQRWDIGQLQGILPNIRKLRVTKSLILCSCFQSELFSEMTRMELLDFSNNETDNHSISLYGPGVGKSNSSLETVTVDGYTSYPLAKISFKGCTNLKNILLSGRLSNVRTLDISGTRVKTLDLTRAIIRELDELYLLDCEKLCAIMWPPKGKRRQNMDKLRINTTQGSSGATRSSSLPALLRGSQVDSEFDWHISVRDARLLVSLEPVYPTDSSRQIYVEIFSPTVAAVRASKNERIIRRSDDTMHQQEQNLRLQQTPPASIYGGIRVDHPEQADDEGDGDATGITWTMWLCPNVSDLDPKESCYMYIQDQRGTSGQAGIITVPDFVVGCAKILHVRDSLSITILPSAPIWGTEWYALEWCRIERCPELDCVFAPHGHSRDSSLISAPELETLKIRGCWRLKRLPATKKEVQCNCEKEWWDNLEWEDGSHKELYMPIHSKYYKKATLLRGSVLR
ncbi:hypothetical protein PR202_gb12500 [Eleusine coracana subsp. coracana]|uniref:Uncharacterized protein n=1 Tax=Eleusine coracana subsp. coracana TaxID=191504 RepID=A0AAV5EQ78_ELECO|nr:hypothetical protein PR202_gb12500 [Eleusine coracana subsp. coracana]